MEISFILDKIQFLIFNKQLIKHLILNQCIQIEHNTNPKQFHSLLIFQDQILEGLRKSYSRKNKTKNNNLTKKGFKRYKNFRTNPK